MARPKKAPIFEKTNIPGIVRVKEDKVKWSDLSFPLQVQVMFSWIMSGLIILSSIIVMLK